MSAQAAVYGAPASSPRQATKISYLDVSRLLMFMFTLANPLVVLLKKSTHQIEADTSVGE